ncbi:class I SAM-dependent methyltransferase [Aeromicrobium fastidiosum]|uniref:Class I SAM-dependent methyltransferase n=1 Tax=Aeromicrobium fastidiosum TaxID=52699 RepID=A0A641AM52_9ACTN|nr:class I SAM-dependent methyltransferase [Aeromicrobium fastidiosum]
MTSEISAPSRPTEVMGTDDQYRFRMHCLVCPGDMEHFARGEVLGDQPVEYQRCTRCGLVAAENPTWLDRSYSDAIAATDVGLLGRCLDLGNVASSVIRSERLRDGAFLDWAGGYGTLTRLMRDRGLDFRHHDPMATNIFARGFEGSLEGTHYDLVTAIEVLEHLTDPRTELQPVADSTDLLLATTQLMPEPTPRPGEWEYYATETGQHITFYTEKSIQELATSLGFTSVVSGSLVHLFHRGQVSSRTAALVRTPKLAYMAGLGTGLVDRRRSLTLSDAKNSS